MNHHYKKIWIMTAAGLCVLLLTGTALANNLVINNVSLEERGEVAGSTNIYITVEFDIDWDNSWRNETNYDGVWIFGRVNYSTTTYEPLDLVFNTSNLIDPEDWSPGSNKDLEFKVGMEGDNSGRGFFMYRKSTGSGTVQSKDVQFRIEIVSGLWDDNISVKLYGIEMVYIPEAPFYAGDTSSTYTFKHGTANSDPWYISSEATIRTTNNATGSYYYTDTGQTGEFSDGAIFTIPAAYPKGYQAFWVMKYEVTEEQWVDFFNTLPDTGSLQHQNNRDITAASGKNSTSVVSRNTVYDDGGTPATQTTSRGARAMNYIHYMDLAAYLDWAHLRPLSELEFEKIARGPLSAVADEYAWGTTTATEGLIFTGSPEDQQDLTFLTTEANAHFNATTFSQGDTFLGTAHQQGAVRAGIFATDSSSREEAGAGYYGVMELTGNLIEPTVSIGNTTSIGYWPTNGDGILSSASLNAGDGNAVELGWVGLDPTHGIRGVRFGSASYGIGWRGGTWFAASSQMPISERARALNGVASRFNYSGGRGARTISPLNPLTLCGNGTVEPPEQCDDALHSGCTNCLCGNSGCSIPTPSSPAASPVDGISLESTPAGTAP